MAHKIFYSWQSDLPDHTNLKFIEEALSEAIARLGESTDELYEPTRELELDKDTKGVPGSPPVAETIFQKIDECVVFVPDLTFVGVTEKKRPIPNPNVLVEYGWALANRGHSRIVAIANTAFGALSSETVPFDLRHHLWPITYHLEEGTEDVEREAVKNNLVNELKEAIRIILSAVETDMSGAAYELLQQKSRISSFLDEGDILCRLVPFHNFKNASDIVWHDGPQMFLRVIPNVPIEVKTPLELRELMERYSLQPLGRVTGTWTEGNEYGAVTFEATSVEKQGTADRIVQVTDHGEIWAIDGFSLTEYETVSFLEMMFANKLAHYLGFMKNHLGVASEVKVIAGLTGIRGRDMWRPQPPQGHQYEDMGKNQGSAARDIIVTELGDIKLEPDGEVDLDVPKGFSYPLEGLLERHAYKSLLPFFEQVCGVFQIKRWEFLPKLRTDDEDSV